MPRVVHFEISAEDLQRAIAFYTACFGWKFKKWEGPMDYWLISTGEKSAPGIDGGLMKRHGVIDGTAVIGYLCTMDVKNVDESVKQVTAAGGQNIMPKMAIPGVGYLVHCKDTEGNIFGMMQADANAR